MPVTCDYELAGNHKGLLTVHGIYLDRRLNQVGRRCTLTHEIIHLERGPVPRHPHFSTVEERLVGILAARRLIPLSALVDALAWVGSEDHHDLADELWVDLDTLRTRLQHLTRVEHARITDELARRRP